ncbi:MAG TPA: CpaF family protein [Dehalococcoidia bacterium]|nr:CpaF family protein [Dehalococcoidia bacterium]
MSPWQYQPDSAHEQPSDGERKALKGFHSAADLEKAAHQVHQLLIEELDTEKVLALPADKARAAVEEATRSLLARDLPHITGFMKDEVVTRVLDEVLGLGPIEGLIRDSSVSEVMVNSPNEVFYERDGIIYKSDAQFRDASHIIRIVERIISPMGRRVDEASPYVDARLADGSRVNITIPPISPKSPTITIRKFRADKLTMDDLVNAGTLTTETGHFLRACVEMKLNTLISGGTGTGKTTLLNALSSFIPSRERIVTIEDPTELKLQQPHVVSMEARPASIEGKHEVSQRDLVRNCLRMRPDRIIVGEVRGPEAFDMLQAMNTGHEGSISTVHSNSPRDALHRVENMVLMCGFDLPVRVIREHIASAIHLIIHLSRFRDGSRKVTHITEVTGMEGEIITLQDIFTFEQEGFDKDGRALGELLATGIRPSFAERFAQAGVALSDRLFLGVRW